MGKQVCGIKAKFKWEDWESGRFTQCGVVVEQKPEGFELSQPHYVCESPRNQHLC